MPNGLILLTEDLVSGFQSIIQPQWGIYLNGAPVIASTIAAFAGFIGAVNTLTSLGGFLNLGLNINNFSIVDFEYKQDWTISDYPVEQGAFESYDKVQLPFDVRMRVAAGGSESNRQSLLDTVDAAANTLALYDVYTPEALYQSCNITHYDYRRTAENGAGLIVVDIWLVQIRVTATAAFTNTLAPGVAGQQGNGAVAAQTPTPQQSADFSDFE